MMIEKSPKLIWGVVSIGIYLFVVAVLIFYFNTRNETKPKHYVKKDKNRIHVTLVSPQNIQKKKIVEPQSIKSKPKTKIKLKVKSKPKKILKKKVTKKKLDIKPKKTVNKKVTKKIISKKKKAVEKKKRVEKKLTKKVDLNLTKIKKENNVDLFAKIHTSKISPSKVKQKKIKNNINVLSASKRISDSIKKQKSSDHGEENIYFSKVEKMLKDWPARSDFLGEEAIVELSIKPTGKFRYKVKSSTDNIHFKNSIVSFLKQLQKIGFGRHNAGRTYEFKVEFTTKQ